MYRKKNAIYTPIIKINCKLNNILKQYNFLRLNTLDDNDFDKEKNNEQKSKKLKMTNSWTITYEKTMQYKNQLKESSFINEDEIEDLNIIKKDDKIQYCSMDLLLKKICEDNSFNIDIYINSENSRTFNFINAFIYQCFGFISYEKLIEKLLEMYKYYKYYKHHNNKTNNKILKKILILIFKVSNYLFDNKNKNCSYFQFSNELINKIKKFFEDNNNNIKEINVFLENIKEKRNIEGNDFYKNKNMDLNDNNESQLNSVINLGYYATNSFKNYPHAEFEFNMLNYNAKDIALIISYISIKKYMNLYNHLYELNPTIKNKKDKPHLFALSDFANKLSNFLFEESLSYDLLKDRKLIVEKIIEILKELKNLNNFNDLLAVFSALMSISNNLPKTFREINTESLAIFKEINKLCYSYEKIGKMINFQNNNIFNDERQKIIDKMFYYDNEKKIYKGWYVDLYKKDNEKDINYNLNIYAYNYYISEPINELNYEGSIVYGAMNYPEFGLIGIEDKFNKTKKIYIMSFYSGNEYPHGWSDEIDFDSLKRIIIKR